VAVCERDHDTTEEEPSNQALRKSIITNLQNCICEPQKHKESQHDFSSAFVKVFIHQLVVALVPSDPLIVIPMVVVNERQETE
jgi:hypothetical protein